MKVFLIIVLIVCFSGMFIKLLEREKPGTPRPGGSGKENNKRPQEQDEHQPV